MSLRVGIAGYGLAGRYFHAPLLKGCGFEVAAVLTTNAMRAGHALEDFPKTVVVQTIEELVGHNLDLVVVASANLLPGDEVVFATSLVGTFGNLYGNVLLRNVKVLGSTDSNQVPISNILPANIKQIDFIRSIVERFKLVFVPSKQISKHFEICPWDEWVQQGEIKDWSYRFDGKIDFKTYPLFLV
jgi:hypothetical protein